MASVLAVTLAYHLLRWATPFGDFNKLRMRKTNEAPGRVRKYVVASCERPALLRLCTEHVVNDSLSVHDQEYAAACHLSLKASTRVVANR